jgi:heptosyltransferase-3
MNIPLTVIYVSYGPDQLYHSGVLFNWLRLVGLGYVKSVDNIIVYTDQPNFYDGYPVTIRKITPIEFADWTLNGRYHFRIKTKALIEATNLYGGKLLLIDSDRLINKPLNKIFDTISSNTCLFAADEGALASDYEEILNSEKDDFLKHFKDLTHVNMYCSALIGVSDSMLSAIKLADKLMLQWLPKTNAHTVEQFAISQALLREGTTIVSAAKWIDDFNSKGKKAHAKHRINSFFITTQGLSFDEKAQIAAKWSLRRTFIVWLQQKLKMI